MKKSNFIVNIDLFLAAIALTVLVCVTFGGVIMRYFVGKPIIWAEEVQLWCFLWMTFLGAGAAFRHGSHVAVEMVVSLFPQNIQKFIEKMDYVICMVVLGYLGFLGCDIIKLMMKKSAKKNATPADMRFKPEELKEIQKGPSAANSEKGGKE